MVAPRSLLTKPLGWGHDGSPFHEGERAVQSRIGVRERIEQTGRRIVRDSMPAEHREFFEDLPFLLVGSADLAGGVWASLLVGEPGFVRAPTPNRLQVQARPLPGDPLAQGLRVGAPLGLLGIELSTRRRNRANGHVAGVGNGEFELDVDQSFGNCKQYIQARAGSFAEPAAVRPPTREEAQLSAEALGVLARADTTFIATSSRDAERGGAEGVDVSHRGGRPGFISARMHDGTTLLTLPDFSGNFMFNTFGNLEVNPRAGFLALDFESGAVLSLSGSARVIWDGSAVEAFEGAERLLEFRPESGRLWRRVLAEWSEPQPSPNLRDTGVWPQKLRASCTCP
jgi:predicted pyridoxine 5'-phosphate oxidase superfamily flavin-nucleotide-binding protein